MDPMVWRKSSFSGDENQACVEVAFTTPTIAVRDSKDPSGPHLTVNPSSWRGFLHSIS